MQELFKTSLKESTAGTIKKREWGQKKETSKSFLPFYHKNIDIHFLEIN